MCQYLYLYICIISVYISVISVSVCICMYVNICRSTHLYIVCRAVLARRGGSVRNVYDGWRVHSCLSAAMSEQNICRPNFSYSPHYYQPTTRYCLLTKSRVCWPSQDRYQRVTKSTCYLVRREICFDSSIISDRFINICKFV